MAEDGDGASFCSRLHVCRHASDCASPRADAPADVDEQLSASGCDLPRTNAFVDVDELFGHRSPISPLHPRWSVFDTLRWCWSMWATLQSLLGLPGLWVLQFVRLITFVALTFPVLGPQFVRYVVHKAILKNVVYGPSIRHQLDIFAPRDRGEPSPVVIFVSGGAWLIGYKAWCSMQAMVLQANGVLVIAPDYRNFPQVAIDGMASDVNAAISWTLANLSRLNGDPKNVTLVGQSAGAHLLALVIAERAAIEGAEVAKSAHVPPLPHFTAESPSWRLEQVRSWVGVSGPYDLAPLVETLHARGLHRRLLSRLFTDTRHFSPSVRVSSLLAEGRAALARVPCLLVHGTSDVSVPFAHTVEMAAVLRDAGVLVQVELYEGMSHTDPILEGPMSGQGADVLMARLLALVRAQRRSSLRAGTCLCRCGEIATDGGASQATPRICASLGWQCTLCVTDDGDEFGARDIYHPRVLPMFVLWLARKVNPF